MSSGKEQLKSVIDQQPDDSTAEELVRELAFHLMIQRGLADSNAGRTIPGSEMNRRIQSWQK